MKCWQCGQTIPDQASACIYCGAVQVRPAPKSEEGRALRQLFDQYGADKVLTYPKYLVNGVGDMLGDSGKLRAQLSMAMDSGMGRLYLAQLPAGKPDAAFRGRVQELLTGNAGLSPAAAGRMMQLFDEMIGWETVPSAEDMAGAGFRGTQDTGTHVREKQRRTHTETIPEAGKHVPVRQVQSVNFPQTEVPRLGVWYGGVFLGACVMMASVILGYQSMEQGYANSGLPILLVGLAGFVLFVVSGCFISPGMYTKKLYMQRSNGTVTCQWIPQEKYRDAVWFLAVGDTWVVANATSPCTVQRVSVTSPVTLCMQRRPDAPVRYVCHLPKGKNQMRTP